MSAVTSEETDAASATDRLSRLMLTGTSSTLFGSDGSGAGVVEEATAPALAPIEARAPTETQVNETLCKDLGKPGLFRGDEQHWSEWSFVMRGWLLMSGLMNAQLLQRVEKLVEPIDELDVPANFDESNHKIYYALVMLLRGHAQVLLRSAPVGHGIEAWRVLVRRYERSDPLVAAHSAI